MADTSNLPPVTGMVPPSDVASRLLPADPSTFRKRRKSRKDRDRSSSKRNRREGAPLPGGVFSTEYNVGRRVNFHMGSTHKAILETMSGPALLNAIFEMSSRTTSMVRYLREVGGLPGSEEAKKALLEEIEKMATLQASLDASKEEHEKENERLSEVQQELARVSAELKTASDLLEKAW